VSALRSSPFNVERLDLIVLTHPDSDHLGGLVHVAKQFHVKAYWGRWSLLLNVIWRCSAGLPGSRSECTCPRGYAI